MIKNDKANTMYTHNIFLYLCTRICKLIYINIYVLYNNNITIQIKLPRIKY